MQQPKFTIEDIQYADNEATFGRALDLYETGKVGPITADDRPAYSAVVQGTHPYQVSVSGKRVDDGDCDCYLGQHDRLCKHILALALAVLHASGKAEHPGTATTARVNPDEAKQLVKDGMKKLRVYSGPSRVWFSYQRSLATGAGMITKATGVLPPSKENATYLWRLVERIDKKLVNGIDDSDGVVGVCIDGIIKQLADYAKQAPELMPVINKFCTRKTNFGFEESLRAMLR